jgi:alkylation response protein AidB-like acyl-CoA dehydrogenase
MNTLDLRYTCNLISQSADMACFNLNVICECWNASVTRGTEVAAAGSLRRGTMKSHLDVTASAASTDQAPRSGATSRNFTGTGAAADPYQRLMANIQELAPVIRARAAEIEKGRQIPFDLMDTLRSIGVFRIFVPRSHGGMELDLPKGLRIIEALSEIDGSVGWVVMIGAEAAALTPLLRRDIYDTIYRNGPDVVLAGSSQPAGVAESIDGDWLVNGRWPFASGCQHADWLIGLCVMKKDGKPLPGAAPGVPMLRVCALPARHWRIEDTWHVAGLKGTGSHHIVLRDALVPAHNFVDIVEGTSCIPGPLYCAVQQLIPIMHSAVHLGIADGALSDLVELANTGLQQQRATKPMWESEIFQYELGRIEADLRAAQAFQRVQVADHWQHAVAGTLKDDALLNESTQSALWITAACTRVADACFALGGGAALYESSPLQRRMRDLHAAAQHATVQQRHYVGAGALLLGNAVNAPRIGH